MSFKSEFGGHKRGHSGGNGMPGPAKRRQHMPTTPPGPMPSTLRILLRSNDAGGIIGKGGENIKRMRKKYDCQVTLPDSAGNPERVLTIVGEHDNCLGVFKECLKKVKDDIKRRDPTAMLEIQVLIPQPFMGTIIGTGGNKIKDLRKETNANIKIFSEPMPRSNERSISLAGSEEQVTSCVQFFLQEITNKEPREPIYLYDPAITQEMPPPFDFPPPPPPPPHDGPPGGFGHHGGRSGGRWRGGRDNGPSMHGGPRSGRSRYGGDDIESSNYPPPFRQQQHHPSGGRHGGGGPVMPSPSAQPVQSNPPNAPPSQNQWTPPSPQQPQQQPLMGTNPQPVAVPQQAPPSVQPVQYPPPRTGPPQPMQSAPPAGTGYPAPPNQQLMSPPTGYNSAPYSNPPPSSQAPAPLVPHLSGRQQQQQQPPAHPQTQYPPPANYPPAQAPPSQGAFPPSTQPSYQGPPPVQNYASNTQPVGMGQPPVSSGYTPSNYAPPAVGGQFPQSTPPQPVFPAAATMAGRYPQAAPTQPPPQQPPAAYGVQQQGEVKQVTIPNEYAGAILGRDGSRLEQIKAQAGCDIKMEDPQPGRPDRIITIRGSNSAIVLAEQLMKDSVRQQHKI